MTHFVNWPLFAAIALVFFVSFSADGEAGGADRNYQIAAYNGRAMTDILIAKFADPDNADSACRFKDAVDWLEKRDVILRGDVASVSGRWFSKGKELVLTVGRTREQVVNVKVRVPAASVSELARVQIGQEVAFRGHVSGTWSLLNDLILSDAVLVEANAAREMLLEAQRNLDDILGDCLVQEQPFTSLGADVRCDLKDMARCANAAYPGMSLPFGYRALSRQEWNQAVAGYGYSPDVYSDDGYVLFGNGLRGRLFVHRVLNRVVVAWSGCDLSGRDMRLAGGLDFATCAKHLLSGAVDAQFEQALAITRGVIQTIKGDVWIVGHSLGGCLTTYVSLMLNGVEDRNVRCATFNGLGVSMPTVQGLSSEARNRGAGRLTNVFCTRDPVYNGHRVTAWTGRPPHHFGRSYYLAYQEEPQNLSLIDQVIRYHGMDELCHQIDLLCPWYGNRKHLVLLIVVITLFSLAGWIVHRLKR